MPGYYRNSLDVTVKEVKELWSMGLKCVLLFIKCSTIGRTIPARSIGTPKMADATQHQSHQAMHAPIIIII